jgi:DnaK suppressor protein
MTALDTARARLEAERQHTLRRLASLTEDYDSIVAASRDTNADDEHDPEGATIAFERSQVGSLVRQALDGAYGSCERCGAPIGDGRLEARPLARTCITCAGSARR